MIRTQGKPQGARSRWRLSGTTNAADVARLQADIANLSTLTLNQLGQDAESAQVIYANAQQASDTDTMAIVTALGAQFTGELGKRYAAQPRAAGSSAATVQVLSALQTGAPASPAPATATNTGSTANTGYIPPAMAPAAATSSLPSWWPWAAAAAAAIALFTIHE